MAGAPSPVGLITQGTQPVESLPASLAAPQAPLWGFGRVIALEHPELACVRWIRRYDCSV